MEESCSSNTTPTSGGTLDDPEAPAAATSRKQDNANKYFPSCSSAARLLAGARIVRKTGKNWLKGPFRNGVTSKKKLQSDPEAAAKAREGGKGNEAEYRARQKGAKAEKWDYELEWEVYKASQKDEMCRKVADALDRRAMALHCGDPNILLPVKGLVKDIRGTVSPTASQTACWGENVARGGSLKFSTGPGAGVLCGKGLKTKLGPKFTGSLEPGTWRAKINATKTKEGSSIQEEMEVPAGES
ncbi:hypothetical protein C8R47DRAFT_1077509 [Mycena vitilis]|nr:hypothetical protein C8R47DRAFT_1085095 [Mycena vitilis]KAJ6471168.1 hypothetical protein C8R47DRAFT_1077509 [Mycena vitilis]